MKEDKEQNSEQYILDDELIKVIKISQQQIAEGKYLTHEEACMVTENWLNKKG